ncbi:MAG: hypothetical protein ACYC19_00715 [Acidimicrobiales bacterium]
MISLETSQILVSLEPTNGGKITSLYHRPSRREWLETCAGVPAGSSDAMIPFDDGDMCGWDEMMPTIAPCRYPGTTIELADHGELWRQAWMVLGVTPTSVAMVVRDSVLGYRMERTLHVDGAQLSLTYRVTNEADVDRHLLWAAHPLFAHHRGTRMELDHFELFDPSTEGPARPWTSSDVTLDDVELGWSQKLFARATSENPVVSLTDSDGARLSMRWNSSDVPYLGIWMDNCSLSRHPVIALEPTNANNDALDAALATPGVEAPWRLEAGRSRDWRLEIELSETDGLRPVRPVSREDVKEGN